MPGLRDGAAAGRAVRARTGFAENFFGMEQVCEAAFALGLVGGPEGIVNVADVVGPMTGLDMTKYDLQLDLDARGWFLVRRAP